MIEYISVDGFAENSTTMLVDSMTVSGSDWSDTLSYTYDCKGNIETITENGEQKAKYYYDELNQLIREDNAWFGKTIAYTYDNGGNILSVSEYAITSASDITSLVASSTDTYAYTDSNWKDKLTAYNGNTITYDVIGNPLTYYNGYEFDWQNGRQLASVNGTGRNFTYTYNSDGIRTSKTINGVTTTYTLEGSNIVKETNGTDTIWYFYDASGSLTGFELNGTPYFYVKNVQGDITAITNQNGDIVAEYTYDSWGKLVSITGSCAGSVGAINHFLYRGYYYDYELGFYYLNSRYYDPSIKRFINADGYIFLNSPPINTNLFTYCCNNPVVHIDKLGTETDSITLEFSISFLFIDFTASVSYAWDDDGNSDVILSYSTPWSSSSMQNIGFCSIGGGFSYTHTELDSVDDLVGKSTTTGFGYRKINIDLINCESIEDIKYNNISSTEGYSIGFGVSSGIDIHHRETTSISLLRKTKTSNRISYPARMSGRTPTVRLPKRSYFLREEL